METVLFCSLRTNQDRIKMTLDFNYALGQPRIKTFSFYNGTKKHCNWGSVTGLGRQGKVKERGGTRRGDTPFKTVGAVELVNTIISILQRFVAHFCVGST